MARQDNKLKKEIVGLLKVKKLTPQQIQNCFVEKEVGQAGKIVRKMIDSREVYIGIDWKLELTNAGK